MTETGRASFKEEYKSYTSRKVLLILACVALAVLFLGLSVYFGGSDLSLGHIYQLIWDHLTGKTYEIGTDDFHDDYIVWKVRLPRAVFALIAGAGLAVGGAVMQSVMKNPLADPYTTGISSGACLGMAVAMILGISMGGATYGAGGVVNSFVFAIIPMIVMIMISQRFGSSPATMILAGVAISYMFNAGTTLLMMITDADTLSAVYRWQVGSLSDITWNSVPVMAVINMVGIVVLLFLSKKLNVLSLGDENAKSLGLNVDMMRVVCLLILTMMVASVVCYCGIIGFVGLVVPHIVRRIIESDNLFVIPASAAVGAVFMLGADSLARYLSPMDNIPVGVILSLIGAPIFLYIIIRSKREVW